MSIVLCFVVLPLEHFWVCTRYTLLKYLEVVWYIILNIEFQFLTNITRIFTLPNGQYSKKNKNLHLKFYLFLTSQPMKNVFYYWSDKTKEDNKIIDLLHREVKLDKISPSQKKLDKFLFFFLVFFLNKKMQWVMC